MSMVYINPTCISHSCLLVSRMDTNKLRQRECRTRPTICRKTRKTRKARIIDLHSLSEFCPNCRPLAKLRLSRSHRTLGPRRHKHRDTISGCTIDKHTIKMVNHLHQFVSYPQGPTSVMYQAQETGRHRHMDMLVAMAGDQCLTIILPVTLLRNLNFPSMVPQHTRMTLMGKNSHVHIQDLTSRLLSGCQKATLILSKHVPHNIRPTDRRRNPIQQGNLGLRLSLPHCPLRHHRHPVRLLYQAHRHRRHQSLSRILLHECSLDIQKIYSVINVLL